MFDPPVWHQLALCRGDGPDVWSIGRGENVEPLRSICRRCPVAVDCMLEGLAEEPAHRGAGPVRVGVTGTRSWSTVRWLVAELDPVTRGDWEMFTAWVLDDGLVAAGSVRVTAPAGGAASNERGGRLTT